MNCPLLLQDPLLYPQCWVVSWYQVESPRLQAPPADCRFPATRPRRLQSHSGRPHQDVMLQAASSRIAESSRHWLCTAVSSRQSPLSAYPVQSDKMSTHFRYSLQHSHQTIQPNYLLQSATFLFHYIVPPSSFLFCHFYS